MTRGRVIVVGSVNIDLVVDGRAAAGPGETVIGGRFAQHHGGKGGNQAVAAARLGRASSFVGAVGDDAFGDGGAGGARGRGHGRRRARTLTGEATGVALILVDAAGENSIAVAGGANAALEPGPRPRGARPARPGAGDVVLVGHEIPTGRRPRRSRLATAAGAMTILNPAPAGDSGAEMLASPTS